ncbi:hypothetical protein BH09ACT10_BH09ACT10_17370 [soil metagenome]
MTTLYDHAQAANQEPGSGETVTDQMPALPTPAETPVTEGTAPDAPAPDPTVPNETGPWTKKNRIVMIASAIVLAGASFLGGMAVGHASGGSSTSQIGPGGRTGGGFPGGQQGGFGGGGPQGTQGQGGTTGQAPTLPGQSTTQGGGTASTT